MSKKPGNQNLRDGRSQTPAEPSQTSIPRRSYGPTEGDNNRNVKPATELPELMRFKECARDGNISVKTITRWVYKGFLTEWRPHPKSRTRRIKRSVWEAFKHRHKSVP